MSRENPYLISLRSHLLVTTDHISIINFLNLIIVFMCKERIPFVLNYLIFYDIILYFFNL